jgi:hypothetical protein
VKLQAIESEQSVYLSQVQESRRQRDVALKQVRAERKAFEVAVEERRVYLDEKVNQLEVEQKQLRAAKCEMQDRKDCIIMLQSEIESAQQALSECKAELDNADAMRNDCTKRLDSMALKNKLRMAQLRLRIDAEERVRAEQQAYVHTAPCQHIPNIGS